MTYLIDAVIWLFYAIAACAMCGATIVQVKFMQAAGLPLSTFLRRPWTGMALMSDHRRVFAVSGQVQRLLTFGLLLLTAFAALVIGDSIRLSHSPF